MVGAKSVSLREIRVRKSPVLRSMDGVSAVRWAVLVRRLRYARMRMGVMITAPLTALAPLPFPWGRSVHLPTPLKPNSSHLVLWSLDKGMAPECGETAELFASFLRAAAAFVLHVHWVVIICTTIQSTHTS